MKALYYYLGIVTGIYDVAVINGMHANRSTTNLVINTTISCMYKLSLRDFYTEWRERIFVDIRSIILITTANYINLTFLRF